MVFLYCIFVGIFLAIIFLSWFSCGIFFLHC
jgi:hypothetical protein